MSWTLASKLFGSLVGDEEVSALFTDEALARRLLEVEAALAKVQGELGTIPSEAAQRIAAAAPTLTVAWDGVRAGVERDGFPIVALVEQLRAHVGGEAASYVHWGATTQDIMDTALVLQVREGLERLEHRLVGLIRALASLAAEHRDTLMAGRTHAQQALPLTFGLKVAVWLAPLLRHRQRLRELEPRLLVVQFGGAVGTLAALGEQGLAVQRALANELGLGVPLLPWHTQRDGVSELASWLSLVSGSLAKMAQDVVLLSQTEVAEVRESEAGARGGSSTMPQKTNPIQSELVIALARQNAQLLAAVHQAMIHEHERGTHALQLEMLALPPMFTLTASALGKSLWLAENLVVDKARMLTNIAASNGLMMAEAASFALSAYLPKAEAKRRVKDAVQRVGEQHLIELLEAETGVDLSDVRKESSYLGATPALIARVLAAVEEES